MTRHSSTAWLTRVVILISASSILAAGLVLALTQRPRLTQTSKDSEAKTGSEIRVARDGSLQEALNRAQPGDVIVLESGSVYRGPIRLPRKAGDSYITIQSSRAGELAAGVRVGPGQNGLFAKLQSTRNGEIVVTTEPGAHHYRFVGIEFSAAQAGLLSYDLVRFGDSRQAQTTLASVPHHLVIDRCYIHGFATQEVQRGITLNSAETSVINSYISDIHGQGYDTQALAGWNGPGPFHIVNNYLEAAGENIMFGGADPGIANLVPSDIEIRGNYFFKPLSWKVGDPTYGGLHWSVKNLLELKNARNVVIDGNVLENNWVDAQNGTGVLFTVRNQEGTAPWSIIENVTFSNNVVKNSPAALNLLGSDYNYPSQRSTGLTISNNLFTSINGTFLTMQGFYNVTLDHNTHFQSGNIMTLYGEQSLGFIYRNNLTIRANTGYGVKGDATGEGTIALQTFTPGYTFQTNVLVSTNSSIYPANNSYPSQVSEVAFTDYASGDYRLLTTSPYHNAATDGKDVGADFVQLNAALGATTPTPTPTPTPSATPSPTPTPSATPSPTPASQATVNFVQLDTTTEGSWKNVYGSEGYNTVNDSVSYPSYAQVSVTGYSSPTWMASTTDVRGLQKASASDRVAARWDSSSFLTIELNLTDDATHQIAIYGLDWDGNNRTQRVDILDWASNALLDSRTISSFNGGQYLVWNIKGRVKITVNKLGGKSAVVSGLYFGSTAATPTPTPTPSPTTTVGRQLGKTKRNGQNLSNQLIPSTSSTQLIGSSDSFLAQSAYTALVEFVSDIQQTYDLFSGERNLYPAAQRIDASLKQALAAGNLATEAAAQGDLATVRSRLREAIDKLELTDVLVRYGDVANPIDFASYMVRQQYVDFLDREPDQSGVDFWTNEIASCGSDLQCVEVKRINVSAAFFLSIEFQNTGYYVYRLYKASYGRLPMRQEFVPDRLSIAGGVIVGEAGWDTKLAANKQAFVQGWVERDDFKARYAGLSNEQYVDTLIANAGMRITSAERDNLVQDLVNGASRANVLAKLVENSTFIRAESNSAFVLMQYFGYLERDPDSGGFNFWLGKLNEFDGNFVNAEMVKAFLVSTEYRQRFGL